MMEYIICKQERALKAKILTTVVLVFSIVMLVFGPEPFFSRVLLFLVVLFVFGFSISYRIKKDFNNQKVFSFFGIPMIKVAVEMDFPEYISVFSGSFSVNNDWSTVSALGTKERHEKTVVRFFTGNKKVTLYKSNDYENALEKANALSKLLDVEVYNAAKE